MTRKSDSFLRTSYASKLRLTELNPGLRHEVKRDSSDHGEDFPASIDVLRERLGRMFSNETRPSRRKSAKAMTSTNTNPIVSCRTTRFNEDGETSEFSDRHSIAPSAHSLSLKDVPDRRSSLAASRQTSLQDFPSWRLPPPVAGGRSIPIRGRAESPVKDSAMRDAVSSDALRSSSSRTFIRSTPPLRLLDYGRRDHRRIQLTMGLNAPLFIGGGTIEGHVMLAIDQNENAKDKIKPLLISKLSIDVVGLEEMRDGRK